MKKLLLVLLAIPFLFSYTQIENTDVEVEIFGVWRTIDNEFVQITRDMDFNVSFMRVSSKKQLLQKGFISKNENGNLEITRRHPIEESFISEYAFSPSKKTLVIMKPNGTEAWVLEKVR